MDNEQFARWAAEQSDRDMETEEMIALALICLDQINPGEGQRRLDEMMREGGSHAG